MYEEEEEEEEEARAYHGSFESNRGSKLAPVFHSLCRASVIMWF
jgi:hypothetical protein